MVTKKLLLLTLLICASFTQTISLTDILKGTKSTAPPPDVPPTPIVDTTDQDFNPPDQFVPCGNEESCGEAKSFKNEKEFQDFIDKYAPKQQIQAEYLVKPSVAPNIKTVQFNDATFFSGPGAASFTAPNPSSPSSSTARASLPAVNPANDFSGTNNQVNNVDQADLLKTDGTYIYTISNQILSIILAYPANRAKVVSKLNFNDFNPSALFLEGDYLAVFGTKWVTNNYIDYPISATARTGAVPSARIAAPFSYRPSYSTAYTFIKIYDVSNRGSPYLLKEFQVSGSYLDGRKLENGFMYLVTSYSFSYLPRPVPWFDFGTGRRDVDFTSIFWYPIEYRAPSAVNVISFDLSDPIRSRKKVVTICGESQNIMYMSEQFIYLTTSSYENGQEYTKIRKIYVRGRYIRPFADGKVVGTIRNQFSLDEYGQFFRIATTSSFRGSSTNNVFVLNYFLHPYGSLTGIAQGQRIYSCRYVERRLYMVTFRQIDPFFVISFKNHRSPKILGQLKVTGFSNYLHPYDEETIIGLGRQADLNGRSLGLKISVFDVSDVRNPVESAKFELEEKYAYSSAEWEHKAFLFSADKNLLAIPGYMDYNGVKFNGAFAFYITKTQITLRGTIDHLLNPADNYYERNVERCLWINDLIYTKSKCLLRINKINQSFDGVRNINIPCNQNEFVVPRPIIIDPIIRPAIDPPRPIPLANSV